MWGFGGRFWGVFLFRWVFLGVFWVRIGGFNRGGLVRVRFGYFLECSLGCVVRRFVLRWEGGSWCFGFVSCLCCAVIWRDLEGFRGYVLWNIA